MPANQQVRTIKINVNTAGSTELKEIADRLGNVTRATKSMATNFNLLSSAYQLFIGYLGVRELVNLSDQMQNLQSRLTIITGSAQGAADAILQIKDLANETKQSIGETGEVFARLGTSLSQAGASTAAITEVTRTLINSFRIAGSTGAETSATIIQLSQAFASGTLRGQELRSVLLQNATLAKLLRERFGKNLAKDAEAGLISVAEVLKILAKNSDDVNEKAKKLTPTFAQTLTKATNGTALALFNLNNQFELSAKFAAGMDYVADNLGKVFTAVSALAILAIPNLIAGFGKLAQATIVFVAANPILAILTAIAAGFVYTSDSLEDFLSKINVFEAAFIDVFVGIQKTVAQFQIGFGRALELIGVNIDNLKLSIRDRLDNIRALKEESKAAIERSAQYAGSDLGVKSNSATDGKQALQDLIKQYEKLFGTAAKAEKLKDILGRLNKEFLTGKINAKEYGDKILDFDIYKINREFAEGKYQLQEYIKRVEDLKQLKLNEAFRDNRLSIQEFNDAIAASKLLQLRAQLDAGKISVQEFRIELAKISEELSIGGAFAAGTQSYLNSIGTTTNQVANAITQTFQRLEDSLLSFIKTGTFNFAKFTEAILDDLTKIIIRSAIIKPLAEGILNFGAGSSGGTGLQSGGGQYASPNLNATGNVYDRGLKKFAAGGIVSSPTLFGYGQSKTGLMGEAGPEAIIPLSRGSGGKLGVEASVTPVNINIINQSGAEVQTTETTGPNGERQIELLIAGKVKEGLASGAFDRVMAQSYGLRRKGG